jgi:glycosyltransferase involved in cell wall biosynthesis
MEIEVLSMTFKIALVSTFPPLKEGIATYSLSLVKALVKRNEIHIIVLSSMNYDEKNNPNVSVMKAWTRNSIKYPVSISRKVAKHEVNLVHIQHEYALYGSPFYSGLFPILLLILKLMRKKVIVTMHSVILRSSLNSEFFRKYGAGKSLATFKKLLVIGVTKLIGCLSDGIIVHQEIAKKELSSQYGIDSSKVHVIPHGVESYDNVLDTAYAKKKLNIQGLVVLCFGFLKRGKGIEYVIEALEIVIKKHPDVKLIIAGGAHLFSIFESATYANRLKDLTKERGLNKNVIFVDRYIPEQELPLYFSSADIFVLPYAEDGILSASGVMSKILYFGKPIIFARVYRFSELWNLDSMLITEPENSGSLANVMMRLLESPPLREEVGKELGELAIKESWDNVANKTLSLYRETLK